MDDSPVEYVGHDGPVPVRLPVTQVYGWLIVDRRAAAGYED